jgi:hypothetical protein
LELDPGKRKIAFSPAAKQRMQAGLASLKRNCNTKETPKLTKTPQGIPEQRSANNDAGYHHGKSTESEMDLNSIFSGMGPINPKTFTMPNNAQFAQKWRSFQNTLQQLD